MERKIQEQNTNNNLSGTMSSTQQNGSGRVLLDYLKCAAVGVSIENIQRSFGDNYVLRGVTLDIEPRETVVILGKSGSGKSVLMRHIIGLECPDSGHIFVAGEDINDPDFKKNHVLAMVFQSSALFNSLSVAENVALYLREHKIFAEESRIKEIVSSALDIVGLQGKEDVMPSQISGGMKRRVAAARALVMNPDIILFDEPTAGLDPMMTRTMGDLIRGLNDKVEITQIVVTHDIDLAFYVADRIAILSEGQILEVGTPDQIRSSTNSGVIDFIKPQFE
ncbi:MAG: ABC transporter ATP-binding protein [Thermodesulfobacteriota bacterium]|nr:MAG: ABC transporter ATP-binding protein [Thermodesulfobacteriota bacterium]